MTLGKGGMERKWQIDEKMWENSVFYLIKECYCFIFKCKLEKIHIINLLG